MSLFRTRFKQNSTIRSLWFSVPRQNSENSTKKPNQNRLSFVHISLIKIVQSTIHAILPNVVGEDLLVLFGRHRPSQPFHPKRHQRPSW